MSDVDTLKEKTAKGFFWAALSNGAQQIVTMLIGIVMARLLSVEDYGMVAMLTVFSVIAGNLQESGLTSALCVKKDAGPKDFNAVFWFSVMVSVSIYCVLFLCAPWIAAFNDTPQLTTLGRVIFLGFVISSFGTASTAYLFRHLMVRQKTSSQVVASMASGAVGLATAFAGCGCWSLVAMDLSYKLTYTVLVCYYSPWRPSFSVDLRPALQMFGFGSRLLVTNVLTTLNSQLLQTLLGHFYPARQVGYYSQANKWTVMGSQLLVSMVGNVAQPVLAGVNDEAQRQVRIFRKMLRFTAMLAFPVLGALALVAPEFIPLTVGEKWNVCVPYLQTLCVGCAFWPVCQMFSNLLISKGRSDIYMYVTLLFIACQLGCVLSLCTIGVQTLLFATAGLNVLWLFVWHIATARLTQIPIWRVLADIFPFLGSALVAIAAGEGVAMPLEGNLLRLLVKSIAVIAVYASCMALLRVDIWGECVDFFLGKLRKAFRKA